MPDIPYQRYLNIYRRTQHYPLTDISRWLTRDIADYFHANKAAHLAERVYIIRVTLKPKAPSP